MLTKKQNAVLEFIKQHLNDNGFPPTRKEIANNFNLNSINSSNYFINVLEKKGYIKISEKIARGIKLLK